MTVPIRVLVADDNEDHRYLIVRALRDSHGLALEIDSVRDGEEALDLLYGRGDFVGRARPQLVLLDLKMPRIGGLEVLEQVKRDPELREIPIVVLSSSDRPEDIQEAYRAGGNSYITKPSTPAGLREDLEELSHYWTTLVSLPDANLAPEASDWPGARA